MKKAVKVGNGIFLNYIPDRKSKAGVSITKADGDNDNCFEDDIIDERTNNHESKRRTK